MKSHSSSTWLVGTHGSEKIRTYLHNSCEQCDCCARVLCSGSGGMEECMRDLTGFDDSPDSFPFGANDGVKKMGKGGLASIPENLCNNGAANSQCDLSAYDGATQSPASTREELAGMAGAPKLDVTEVRAVKIYMRKQLACS